MRTLKLALILPLCMAAGSALAQVPVVSGPPDISNWVRPVPMAVDDEAPSVGIPTADDETHRLLAEVLLTLRQIRESELRIQAQQAQ